MREVFDSIVLYTPVASIKYIQIIIAISYAEVVIIFILDILKKSKILFYPTRRKEFILVYHIYTWNILREMAKISINIK